MHVDSVLMCAADGGIVHHVLLPGRTMTGGRELATRFLLAEMASNIGEQRKMNAEITNFAEASDDFGGVWLLVHDD